MKGFNYPAPTGKYKVTILTGSGWQGQKKCRIQMSLRNPKYEGDKLYGILEWASTRFKEVDFILSDTLLRHNLMFEEGISEKEAHIKSQKLGTEWLDRNSHYFNEFENIQIVRWSDLISLSCLNDYLEILTTTFLNNPELKNSVNGVVNGFWSRKYNSDGVYELFAKNGVNYLLEELAVFGILFEDKAIDVYAGQWVSGCIECITDLQIINSYENAHYLEIDLVRNKAFQDKAA
jgi:tRNA-dependent cyclodipeptide synthase